MGQLHKNLIGDELHIGRSQVSAGNPNGVVTAGVIGEFYWDSTDDILYIAEAADNVSWVRADSSSDEWAELTDTPGSISANLAVQGNSGGTALEFGQALRTTDSPTFANLTVPGNVDGRDVSVDGANVDLNTTHRSSDGKNHADVVLNNTHRASDGKNHADVVLNNAHRVSSGVDHSFIDQDVTMTGSPQFASLVLTGDLTVQGTTVTLDATTLLIEDKNIELGTVAVPTDITADGGGITLKGDTDKTILWNNASDAWDFNQNLRVRVGSSGVAASVVANALVVEDSTNNGMSILTPATSVGRVVFGSPADPFGAFLAWSDSTNDFAIGSSKIGANLRLTSGGEATNLTLSGEIGSELANFAKDVTINGALSGLTQLTVDNIDINGNTISATNINGDLILDAFVAGTGVVKVTAQLEIAGSTSQLLLTDTDNDKTFIVKNNLGDFSITEVGGNNSFKILGGAAVNSLKITANQVEIGTRLDVDNLRLDDNTISSTDINGNINLSPNGTGSLAVSTTAIIGSTSLNPDTKLHVIDGSAGIVTAFVGTIATFESSGAGYLSILTPDVSTSGILFGEPSSNLAGAIFYNDPGSPDGFQFRINGNQTKMVIEKDGIGMGTTNPDFTALLELKSTTRGFLGPRMTTAEIDAIVSPAIGLESYDTTVNKKKVFTGTEFKALLTDDLANVVVQETFASTNVRFFGELALPAAQGWTDTATGIATIDLVTQTVFGEVKQVVRHNDDTGGGSTTSKITLTAQNWIDVNNFGASYSGTARLDTVNGASGFFSGLQANAAENPLATGNRRYGILFNSDAGNLRLIEADNNPGNSVTMDGTGGNPLVPFDEWFRWECVVPAGLGAAQVYINGILTTFVPLFIVNGGGLGTQIIVSSGSTAGANRIVYHDNFGVTIFEESSTKTLTTTTMSADVAQVNIPEGKRDYVIILPDGNPRLIGSELRLAVNNLFGTITLQNQTPATPEALFNGLAESVFTVFSKEVVVGVNTVDQGNVYIGFKAEGVARSSAIFAQLHSIIDQIPTAVNPTVITYTNHDAINGIGHSTTLNTGELEILPGLEGTYSIIAQPQVGKDLGGIKVDFNMFLQVDRGSGFVDEDNSNIELTIKDSDIRDVVVSVITIQLQVGDKIRMMQVVSNSAVGMGLKNTDPVVGPPTVPRTPSIIFGMVRIGGI